jgi:hypothetical protein
MSGSYRNEGDLKAMCGENKTHIQKYITHVV